MPSRNTCRLTWVSLTSDVGYLFTAAPAKRQPMLLTLDEGYLLPAAPPDLECGVAPLGPPAPMQPLLLGCGVAPLGFIGRTDVEAETRIPWPPHAKNRLIGKDTDTGTDGRQEKKGMTEDEMVGWHQQLDRHEFECALEVGDGQGSLVCCSPWGHKESDTTEPLN